MNKARSAVVFLGAWAMLLSACASSVTPTQTGASQPAGIAVATRAANTTGPAAAGELSTSDDNAVSMELQLLLGTLKLEGTDLAVTSEQARTLLPLWNNFKAISQNRGPGREQGQATPQAEPGNSETQAPRAALVKQIQAVMTADQLKAIAEIKITRETAMTIMQEQDVTLGGPQPGNGNNPGNGNPLPQGTPRAGGPDNMNGNGGPGVPPSGGQQPGNGQMPAAPAGGGMIPPELIDALIQALEKTSGE
jgi:hypothetical protein